MDKDTEKLIKKLQSDLDELKQKRISQTSIIPASVKQRHLVASSEMGEGDMFYGDGTNNLNRLETGTSGQVLTVTNGVPAWATPTSLTKATASDVDTATDDAKYVTSLAIAGSTLIKYSYTRFKVGSFTRAQDGADGAVAYTGVGFQPKMVIFIAGVDATAGSGTPVGGSIGFDDGTNPFCRVTATSGANNMRSTSSIHTRDNNTWEEAGKITTMGSDGFTITWSKAGTPPSATITVYYLAFK